MRNAELTKPVVLINRTVARQIARYFKEDMHHERGVILIGVISNDKVTDKKIAYIKDAYMEKDRIGMTSTFEFTTDYLLAAKAYVNKTYGKKDMHIIGNCHSHGMYPSFWSDQDYEMMHQSRGLSVYSVVSPSHNTYKVAVKDEEFNIYEDSDVYVVEDNPEKDLFKDDNPNCQEESEHPFPAEAIILNKRIGTIKPDEIQMDEKGNGRIKRIVYQVRHNYTAAQRIELDRRFNYDMDDLKGKRLLIVGAGTIGNLLAQIAVCSGIPDITIVDMDQYHYYNDPRSCMTDADDDNKEKAIRLAMKMAQKAPFDLRVEGINKSIYDLGYGFFKQFDLVLSPVDSIAARMFIDRGCKLYHVPHITCGTGLFQSDFTGNVISFPQESACDLEAFWGTGYKEDLFKSMGCTDLPVETQPQVMGFSAIIAGYTMCLAMKQLLGQVEEPSSSFKYTVNSIGHNYQKDKNALRTSRISKRTSEDPDSLYEIFDPSVPLPAIDFSRNSPKGDLYRLICEKTGKDSSYFDVDLRKSLNVPVAYHSVRPTSEIRLTEEGEVDETWMELPDSHVYYIVDTDGNEDLIEINLKD